MSLIAAALATALALPVAAEDISAGPIWNNSDAQGKCPGVCSSAGGTWDGNWVTTQPGIDSVCKCDIRRAGGRGVRDYDAGPIWNNADARSKCPAVCTSHSRTWTGNWHTKVQGQTSVCACSR